MRPRRLVDEPLQQLRGRDGTAVPPAGILHVGKFRIDHLVVFRSERHTPDPLADLVADLKEPLGELFVIGEQTGVFLPERDDDRTGQSRKIDHELRFETLVHIVQQVGEHQPALRIGVDDLDRLPRHGGDDIPRALRATVGHVLYEPDRADRIDFRLAPSQRMHQADDTGGSRHVAFHVLHASRGLDRNTAGIEADALTDEGERRGATLAAIPAHDDRTTLVFGTLPDAEQRVHSELLHFLDIKHVDGDAELLQPAGAPREFFRVEHVGRLVEEIARNRHAAGDRGAGCKRLLRSRHARNRDLDPYLRRLLLLILAFGLVALEYVTAQLHSERQVGRALRLEGAVGQISDERDIARGRGNSAHGGAPQFDEVARLEIARLADAHDDQARHLKARWRDEVER